MDFNNPKSEIRLPPSYYKIRLAIEDENFFRSQLKKDDLDRNKRSTSGSKNDKPIKSSSPPKEIINLDDDDDDDVIIIDRSNLLPKPLENGISECVLKEKRQRYALAWQYSCMKFHPFRPLLDAMSDHWNKKPSEIDALTGDLVSKLPIPIIRKPPLPAVNVQNSKPKRTNTRRTVVRGPRVQKPRKRATKKTVANNSSASNNQEINNNLNGGENIEQSVVVKENPILNQDENIQPNIENNVSFNQNRGNDNSVNLDFDFDLDLDFSSKNDQNIQPTQQNASNACSNFQKNPDTTSAANQSGEIQPVIEKNVSFNQNLGNDKYSENLDFDFDFDLDLDFSSNNDQNIQPKQQNTSNACSNLPANLNSTSAVNQSGEKSSFDQATMPQSNPNSGNQQNDGNSMVNIDEPKQQKQQKLVPQTVGNISEKDINNNDISYTSCADCESGIICTNCASNMFSEFSWDVPNRNEQVSMTETNNDKSMDESDATMLDMDFLNSGIDFSEIPFPDPCDEEMDTTFDFEQDLWNSFDLL